MKMLCNHGVHLPQLQSTNPGLNLFGAGSCLEEAHDGQPVRFGNGYIEAVATMPNTMPTLCTERL